MRPSSRNSIPLIGNDPGEVWAQGRANAELVPACRELINEIAGLTGELLRQNLPFRVLAVATRAWLKKASIANKRATVSILKTSSVALPIDNDCRWIPVLGKGESDERLHSAISRWLSEEGANCPFSSDTVRRLAWAAIQAEFWLPVTAHQRALTKTHEYGRQLEFQMRCGATTRGNLHSQAPGVYQIFRPSETFPGRYVVGLFGVALVSDPSNELPEIDSPHVHSGDVLRTLEVHRIEPDAIDISSNQSYDVVVAPSVLDIYAGYLVKKSSNIICHAFNSISRSFQYTIFRDYLLSESLCDDKNAGRPTYKRAYLQMAKGISVGADFFCVPTVILRINNIDLVDVGDDDEFIARLRESRFWDSAGIFTAERIPDFVHRQFQIIKRQIDLRGGFH